MINNKSKEAYANIEVSQDLKQKIYNIDTNPTKKVTFSLKSLSLVCVLVLITMIAIPPFNDSKVTLYVENEVVNDSTILSTDNVRSVNMSLNNSISLACSISSNEDVTLEVSEGYVLIDDNQYITYSGNNVAFTWVLDDSQIWTSPSLCIFYEDEEYTYTIVQNENYEWVIERGN